MNTQTYLQNIAKENRILKRPDIRPGYTVRVTQRFQEGNKTRTQKFEGLVIATKGNGSDKTITVRKIASGVGVERIFIVSSPAIESIEVLKIAKVRRSKLYHMRRRSGKAARLKERMVSADTFAIKEDETKDTPKQA